MPNEIHDFLLLAWLRTATDGLCDAAKRRIDAEIRAHYDEAVADALADGGDEDEAHKVALEALGDAKRARKIFRRTYLTRKQAARFRMFAGPVRAEDKASPVASFIGRHFTVVKWSILALGLAMLGLYIRNAIVLGLDRDTYWHLIGISAQLVSWLIWGWLCPWLQKRRQGRRSFVWYIVGGELFMAAMGIPLLADAAGVAGEPVVLPLLVYCAVLTAMLFIGGAFLALSGLQVLRKLGTYTDLYDSLTNGDDEGGRYA